MYSVLVEREGGRQQENQKPRDSREETQPERSNRGNRREREKQARSRETARPEETTRPRNRHTPSQPRPRTKPGPRTPKQDSRNRRKHTTDRTVTGPKTDHHTPPDPGKYPETEKAVEHLLLGDSVFLERGPEELKMTNGHLFWYKCRFD